MTRRPVRRVLSLVLLLAAAAGCGKKGPPQAPLIIVPGPVSDLSASRLGDRVTIRFNPPDKNTDNSTPADLARVEVYALSVESAVETPEAGVIVKEGARVGTMDFAPRGAQAAESPAGPRTFTESLTAEMLKTWKPERPARPAPAAKPAAAEGESEKPARAQQAGPSAEPKPVPVRVYAFVPVSAKGRRGPGMTAVVPIVPGPSPVPRPIATYVETAIRLTWLLNEDEAADAYNVYDAGSSSTPDLPGRPLNENPLKEPTFDDPRLEFGKERCYSITAVKVVAERPIESVLSEPSCVTPEDTFPPAPPTGLAAVAGPDAMSLIWDAVDGRDLAGYVVLRGVAGDDTLQALTPEPIKETTFKDATVAPGTRYVYAVVAVDTAGNRSVEARVEETAR